MLYILEFLAKFLGPTSIMRHARGNDLGKLKSVMLIKQIRKDITALHESFPNLLIMLSGIMHWWTFING